MKVELLRTSWVNVVIYEGDRLAHGFKNWLSASDFFVDRVDGAGAFVLSVRDKDLFGSALAADAVSYGIHALQSLHSIRSTSAFPKIGAWHLIKAYYAAFFAAHTILRLTGAPFTHLETGHVSEIFKIARLGSVPCPANLTGLSAGNYHLAYDTNLKTLTAHYKPDSHRDLWGAFNNRIKSMSLQVLSSRGPSRDLTEISDALTRLSSILEKGGAFSSGNWLSVVRNEVNYRTSDEIWFPFKKNKIASSDLFYGVRTWRNSSISIDACESQRTEYERFFFCCIYIVQFMNELLLDYGSVSMTCKYSALYKKYKSLENGTGEL